MLNLNQVNDTYCLLGGQLHQSDPVYRQVTLKILPLGGLLTFMNYMLEIRHL